VNEMFESIFVRNLGPSLIYFSRPS